MKNARHIYPYKPIRYSFKEDDGTYFVKGPDLRFVNGEREPNAPPQIQLFQTEQIERGLPFLKWAGGKTQLLDQYKPLFPKKMERYFEPFLGSAAVFFYIFARFRPKKIFLSDMNEELINCYKVVQNKCSALIGCLVQLREQHYKEGSHFYYRMRKTPPATLTDIERAARLIYLNKTCFNGLYRVNSKGEFNVPMGSYKNPQIFDSHRLYMAGRILKQVEISKKDYRKILDEVHKDDFVYLDPPYYPISRTSSFISYTEDLFLEEEQKDLANLCRKLDQMGCKVMLSNSNSEFIKKLFNIPNFQQSIVYARRTINSMGTKRGVIQELVIRNYC